MPSEKKILIQTDSNAMGGAEKYLFDIIPSIKQFFDNVTLICLSDQKVGELREFALKEKIVVKPVSKRYWFSLKDLFQIAKSIFSSDVIFANKINPAKSLIVIFIALIFKKKICCIEHLNIDIISKYRLKPLILKFLIRKMMNKVSCVIVLSNNAQMFFEQTYGYQKSLTKIIYNGVEIITDLALSDNATNTCRAILVGRLSAQKNQTFFIENLRPLIDKMVEHDINLVIELWGDGELRNKIKTQITDYNLQDNVILKGFSSKKDEIYSCKDILVMPSLSEGFPFVMLEAASYGVPIIATDVGGISDFVEHGVNGYLVSANNFNQINDYILDLAINPQKRKKMGLQAMMKVESSFTKERMVDSTIKVLKNL